MPCRPAAQVGGGQGVRSDPETPKFWILRLLDPEPMILTVLHRHRLEIGSNCRALEHDENEVSSSGRILVPAQPVDATQVLNLSAGVSNAKVFCGRSFS